MNKTKIDWADYTWNPITGCYHSCPYCYAKKIATRFGSNKKTNEKIDVLNKKPDNPYPYGFEPTLHDYPEKQSGLDAKKHSNVFVGSMSDVFGSWVPEDWIIKVFDVCKKYPQHNYLFLTKNPSRYKELKAKGLLPQKNNFYYGTTINCPEQEYFASPEYNTFLSIEPIMADFGEEFDFSGINWLIVGAETGNRKGKIIPKRIWINNFVSVARKNNIPIFLKSSLKSLGYNVYKHQECPDNF